MEDNEILQKHENKLLEHENKLMEHENKIKESEKNIRKLEESDIRQQIQLANIEKSQSEIKLMINESTREQQRTIRELLTAFTGQILENNKVQNEIKSENNKVENNIKVETNKTENNIKFYNTKQFWIILGTIATAIGTAIGHFFK
jgi:hypothetical protein